MNRVIRFLFLAGVFWFPGCSEEESAPMPDPLGYKSESVLQLHPSLLAGGRIDWTRETELLQSAEVFEDLAARLGLESGQLREAVRFEIDVLEEKVRVIVHDGEAETAKNICQAYADLYLEFRKAKEVQLAKEALVELESKLAGEEAKAKQALAEIEKLLKENGLPASEGSDPAPTLEQDRLTYQKALEALKEAQVGGTGVPEDGAVYRKEE